jgi:hypothetical protein
MEALGFNVRVTSSHTCQANIQASSGFLEGIVRGYKSGLLTQNAYHNLTQCENLEGECCPLPCPPSHVRARHTLTADASLHDKSIADD